MTLQNGLTTGDRALLWSDTAYTDTATGKVVAFQNKIFTTQGGVPAAVSMTTIGNDPQLIVDFVSRHSPIYFQLGDLLEACEMAARSFVDGQPESRAVRLMVAGWCSETISARLFLISSQRMLHVYPFEAAECDHSVNTGNGLEPYHAALAEGLSPEHMPAIIEAQRATPIDPDFGGIAAYYGIGGNVLEVEVTVSGATSRVVREWADQVGERIQPESSVSLQAEA